MSILFLKNHRDSADQHQNHAIFVVVAWLTKGTILGILK